MPSTYQYRERDYEFANTLVTLRTTIGLTQQGLATLLRVSSRAVENWEQGLTTPKAEHLKAFLALGVRQQAFPAGREAEQIRALWRAAHQKVLLDERWLSELLSRPSPAPAGVAGEPSPGLGQGSAAASETLALWTVPYTRNPHFTGRDELLEQLTAQLSPQEAGQPMALRRAALTQAQVIKGLGGIGKTQTAVEYAYRAHEQGRYTHTLWISAGSSEALLMSFAALADLLPDFASAGETDQRKLVAAVIRWLERCPQPWLLLVDNADDLSLVQPYLPLRGNGSVLLTTRASATGWLAPSLEVDTMGLMESAELLLRRAQRFAQATDEEINEAANLAVALAQLPLALDQAGAYIEETGCSLRDYQGLYQTHRGALLARRGRQATGYPASVATTWSLSFEYIKQKSPAAAELLQLCALLAPDHIPEELLTDGAPYWPPALQQAATDRFRFNQALETLLAFSLVKRLSKDHLLSTHRLVQAVQMERMEPEEQLQWAKRVVCAVNAVFPRDPENEVAAWPQCQRYLEQAQACDMLIQEYHILLPEAADVLDRTGTYLCERALYSLAESLLQRALSIREQHLGPEQPPTATSLHNLAMLYWKQGKYAQAEPLHQRALRIRKQQLGSEHSGVAEVLNDLGLLYADQGQYGQAEPLYQQALRIWEQQLGPDHPRVASPLNNLGVLYSRQGKYTQAEPLYQRALRIYEQHLGDAHPSVATSLVSLAAVYYDQGQYGQAEPLCQSALSIYEQQLGDAHPLAAFPLHWLALVSAKRGKSEESERLERQALRIWEEQLGSEHPYVANALHGLALLSAQQRRERQAEAFFQRALRIREQQLGETHLQTTDVQHDFAGFLQTQGKLLEAARLYQRALTTREHVLGPDHPLTIESRERLHAVLVELGQTLETDHGQK